MLKVSLASTFRPVDTATGRKEISFFEARGAWQGVRDADVVLDFDWRGVVKLSRAVSQELLWRMHVPDAATTEESWRMSGEDCSEFAWALSLADHPASTMTARDATKQLEYSRKPLPFGTIALFMSNTLGMHHYALALGNGFYLSFLRPFCILLQNMPQLIAFWEPASIRFLQQSPICAHCSVAPSLALPCLACNDHAYCSTACRAAAWPAHHDKCHAVGLVRYNKAQRFRKALVERLFQPSHSLSGYTLLTSFPRDTSARKIIHLQRDALMAAQESNMTAFSAIAERALSTFLLVSFHSFVFARRAMTSEEQQDAKTLSATIISSHDDSDEQRTAVVALRRRLCVGLDAPVSDTARNLAIDACIEAQLLPRLLGILQTSTNEALLVDAGWVLANIAAGDHANTRAVVEAGS